MGQYQQPRDSNRCTLPRIEVILGRGWRSTCSVLQKTHQIILLIETEPDSELLEIVYIDHNHFHLIEQEERVADPATGPLISLLGDFCRRAVRSQLE